MTTPGTYRHFKGNKYRVHGIAAHCDSLEQYVVYSRMYEPGPLDVKCDFFVRSKADFEAMVLVEGKEVPRFKQLSRGRFKEKGSEFERVVCKQLSLWVSKRTRDDLFSRTVLSGGQATSALKQGKKRGNPGDIACADPLGYEFTQKILVECKHWRDLDLIALINERGELFSAIQKVKRQAMTLQKEWCFIAKQNNKAPIFITDDLMGIRILALPIAEPAVLHSSYISFASCGLHIFSFEEILEYLTHEQLLSCCQLRSSGAKSDQRTDGPGNLSGDMAK